MCACVCVSVCMRAHTHSSVVIAFLSSSFSMSFVRNPLLLEISEILHQRNEAGK